MNFETVFIISFLFFWCLIYVLLNRSSGWSKLSFRYKNKDEFSGKIIKGCSAKFSNGHYGWWILGVGRNDQYLHLSLSPFSTLFGRKLLVPINDVEFSKCSRNLLFRTKISFKKINDVTICISKRVANQLEIKI